MPIEFSTCLERDLLLAKWTGLVTLDEFKGNYFNYLGDVNYRAGRTELIDQRAFEDFDGDFNAIRSALNFVNRAGEGPVVRTRTIVLAPADGVFGLGRMYQQLADMSSGIQVEVYTAEEEALKALGLPYATLAELHERETFHPAALREGIKGMSD